MRYIAVNDFQMIIFRNRHHLIRLQYCTFRRQSISSTVVLGIALLVAFYLVNFNASYNYDSGVILDNSDCNMLIFIIAGIGIFSAFLSVKPSWIKLFKSLNEKMNKLDRLNSLEEPIENQRRYLKLTLIILMITPFILTLTENQSFHTSGNLFGKNQEPQV